MALSVASFSTAAVSGTAPKGPTISWSTGDIIVVVGIIADGGGNLSTPTATGLTFSASTGATTDSAGGDTSVYFWTATAAASGSSVAVSVARSGSTEQYGVWAWVITGSPSGLGNTAKGSTGADLSVTTTAGSVVLYALGDWNAVTPAETPITGSGTATERVDGSTAGQLGYYLADWVGTSATTANYGITSYSGLNVVHGALEILAPTSSDTNADAGAASATATANNATTAVDANAGQASATAAANNATVNLDSAAGAASATATALNATTTADINAGAASATATALDATANIDANAGAASATATAYDATVTTDSKWENYTHDFPGSSLDSTFWTGSYGDAVTVSGNKATFPSATVTYSGISTSTTGHDLIGSYVLVQLDPRSTGGFSGITVKDDGTNVDILSISYRHTAGQLQGAYNGSDWSDTDSSATVAFTDAGVWFRLREASGTGYMEYSSDGSSWTVLHSDTMSASALTALAGCKVELNCGPFSSSMTTGPSFANFNLPPTVTNADAGAASATATAQTPTANVDTDAGVASATATAYDATVTIDTDAEVATATATAHDATAGADVNADAGLASATAAAADASSTVDSDAELASATATAYDATVTTSSNTNADAGLASATTAAQDATTTVDSGVEAANATAAAHDASSTVDATAAAASATAAAYDSTSTVGTDSGVASATATAYDATVSISGTQFRLTALAPIRALDALDLRAAVQALSHVRALYAKEPTRVPA